MQKTLKLMQDFIDTVDIFCAYGWEVFPLSPRSKKPYKDTDGLLEATNDFEQAMKLFNPRMTDARRLPNIGIRTGKESDLWVLDVDFIKHPEAKDYLVKLIKSRDDWPESLFVIKTRTGGYHYYFRWPEGIAPQLFRNRTNLFKVPGLDVRADGGYVVAPYSIVDPSREEREAGMQTGKYEKLSDIEKVPFAPEWFIEMIQEDKKRSESEEVSVKEFKEGSRNNELFRIGCSMRAKGFSSLAIEQALLVTNKEECTPPLDDVEVLRIAESCSTYERGTANSLAYKYHNPPPEIVPEIANKELGEQNGKHENLGDSFRMFRQQRRQVKLITPSEAILLSSKFHSTNSAAVDLSAFIELGNLIMSKGKLIGALAPTGAGKTDFLFNVMRYNPQFKFLFLTADMPIENVIPRLVQMEYKVEEENAYDILRDLIDCIRKNPDTPLETFLPSFTNMRWIDQACTVAEMADLADQEAQETGEPFDFLMVDYNQLIKGDMNERTVVEKLTNIAADLQLFRDKTGCGVWDLAQPNRASTASGGKLHKHSARGAGAWEENKDVIFILERDSLIPGRIEVRIVKYRGAQIDEEKIYAVGHRSPDRKFMKWEDLRAEQAKEKVLQQAEKEEFAF